MPPDLPRNGGPWAHQVPWLAAPSRYATAYANPCSYDKFHYKLLVRPVRSSLKLQPCHLLHAIVQNANISISGLLSQK